LHSGEERHNFNDGVDCEEKELVRGCDCVVEESK